uniref:Maelstrom domain-containing protein n=1 Tax=Anopheles minimus TaxID=112268 RepID=A0A182VU07_9DIPT
MPRRRARPAVQEKLNSLGIPLSQVEQRLRSKNDHIRTIKNLITERVKSAESRNEIEKEEVYIISMGYFGRTLQGTYLPAELGVVKYSMQGGVMDRMHMYINPGEMPLGAPLSVQTHTGKTHQLPIPPNAWGIADKNEVAVRLLSFLAADDEIPLLFTDELILPQVESMLRDILSECIQEKMLYVCPLSELFCSLKQATERHFMNKSTFPSALTAQYILQIDCYGYAVGISCEYHEKESNMLNCALSQATRWAYTISKYCCEHMGIDCVPGKHIPLQLFPSESVINPSIIGGDWLVKQDPSENSEAKATTSNQKPFLNSEEPSLINKMETLSVSNDEPSYNPYQSDEFPELPQSIEPSVMGFDRGRGRGSGRRGGVARGRYTRRY